MSGWVAEEFAAESPPQFCGWVPLIARDNGAMNGPRSCDGMSGPPADR